MMPANSRSGGVRKVSPSRASSFEPHVGKRYRIEMQSPDGEAFYVIGESARAHPGSRHGAVVAVAGVEEGDLGADGDDVETLVELSFSGSRRCHGGRDDPTPVSRRPEPVPRTRGWPTGMPARSLP